MSRWLLAVLALGASGCFFELKGGYGVVKQSPAAATDSAATGSGVSLAFSIGTFIDTEGTMVAVHYPFYSLQTNASGKPVTQYRDHPIALRIDHDVSRLRRTLGFASKRRLTLALDYGTGGSFERADEMKPPCDIISCYDDAKGATQLKAFAGYTFQMGVPGGLWGEGIGVSFGPYYAHWSGGPTGSMNAFGAEVRLHSALFYKMVGGDKPPSSIWDSYVPSRGETPLPTPDPVPIPSYDHLKNPNGCQPNCY